MRVAVLMFCLLMILSGCGYSVKSQITIRGEPQQLQVELDQQVKHMRRHRDGCFSERMASMVTTGPLNRQVYSISSSKSAMDLSLSVSAIGNTIELELNEWSEESFTPYVADCYKGLLEHLISHFGAENLSVIETCKSGKCR